MPTDPFGINGMPKFEKPQERTFSVMRLGLTDEPRMAMMPGMMPFNARGKGVAVLG